MLDGEYLRRADREYDLYAVPKDVSPLAFEAILNYRRGTVVMGRRRLGIRYTTGPSKGRMIMKPLRDDESWEDACRALGIL